MAEPLSEENINNQALSDVVVLDLTRVLSGPFATMLLGDLGARVIKVERPGVGDETRSWGPPFIGEGEDRVSTYFLAVNRNKESVLADLQNTEGLEMARALLARADVVVENFRPGVLGRLGLSHKKMLSINPRLVIVSITGFGHDGPDASRPGYDQILQGEAGWMNLTGPRPGEPTKVGVPVGDVMAGMFAVVGALAGLHDRERSGRGGVVHTSLLAALVATQVFQGTRWLVGNELPTITGNDHPTVVPYGAFECADGTLQIAVGNDGIYERFAPVVGIDPSEERFANNAQRQAHRGELELLLRDVFKQATVATWLERLKAAGVPAGVIRNVAEVYESDQVLSQNLIMQVEHPSLGSLRLPGSALRFTSHPEAPHRPPPRLGEHTRHVQEWLDKPASSTKSYGEGI